MIALRNKKHLGGVPQASVRAADAKDAYTKLGALVRSLHTLGVYDKLRTQLAAIEKEIKQ